ncbi:glycosyl transferase family 1 [Desulfuromonas versatilis]|uniref:Glycosyl transferase family 1 n=1 Tax=Desulfuromonas versatilis TaxID=2802975 RepID=A0ABM8HX25_9BACT|nr:glycosyltransferase family 4 protein [Desulfuromonas versatilis]BCR05277.1 glycosyl transferase family 1 [Desulfuromonas versatilis]
MLQEKSCPKEILWIKADPLHPLDSGGKIRTYQMLKEWHKRHNITYIALITKSTPNEAKERAGEYSSKQFWIPCEDEPKGSFKFYLELLKNLLFSDMPYVIDKYYKKEAHQKISEIVKEYNYDIVVLDFLSMSRNIISKDFPMAKSIVFQHNVESQIWKRHYEVSGNLLKKAYMYLQWQRYKSYEAKTCSQFAGVIAVSEADQKQFKDQFRLENVLGYVPTGVDVDFFSSCVYQPEPGHIVFLGSMDWMPNIDGIIEFSKNIYPLIRESFPTAKLTILGRNPTSAVRKLANLDNSISVTGSVDDIRPFIARAAVSVVPLRVGGGTRIKIFETMAMGVPVVSTTIGAEGLPVVDGENIFIADKSEMFASRVIELLQGQDRALEIGRAGQKLVREQFTWGPVVDKFDQMCLGVVGGVKN